MNPEWRYDFQGSVFPVKNQDPMRFEVTYTDAGVPHSAQLVFTKDTMVFHSVN
jgi:hypothetical protein